MNYAITTSVKANRDYNLLVVVPKTFKTFKKHQKQSLCIFQQRNFMCISGKLLKSETNRNALIIKTGLIIQKAYK